MVVCLWEEDRGCGGVARNPLLVREHRELLREKTPAKKRGREFRVFPVDVRSGTSCQYHLSVLVPVLLLLRDNTTYIVFFIFFILPLMVVKAFGVTKLLEQFRL